jgi:hypothetical protein
MRNKQFDVILFWRGVQIPLYRVKVVLLIAAFREYLPYGSCSAASRIAEFRSQ